MASETLRDRQRRLARELIMQTAADLIVETGLEDVSLADVAERAGVSKRTLYNYFDSRDTLLAEIRAWSDELTLELGGVLAPEGLDTLPEVVHAVWRTWAAQGTVHQAAGRIDAAFSEDGVTEARLGRRARMAESVRAVRPDITEDRSAEIAAVFHALASAPVFERLTAEDGLDVDTAASLAGWVFGLMRDALADGRGPDD